MPTYGLFCPILGCCACALCVCVCMRGGRSARSERGDHTFPRLPFRTIYTHPQLMYIPFPRLPFRIIYTHPQLMTAHHRAPRGTTTKPPPGIPGGMRRGTVFLELVRLPTNEHRHASLCKALMMTRCLTVRHQTTRVWRYGVGSTRSSSWNYTLKANGQ